APLRLRAKAAAARRSAVRSLANSVHGTAGGLPGVVRGARTEPGLVRNHARIAPDLFRARGVAQQVRVVALLPDEHEVRRGHEVGHERAALGRTGKRIGADAEPAGVIVPVLPAPELLELEDR